MAFQFRRGPQSDRLNGFVPAAGEPIYDTTLNTVYIGDGVTAGGNPISAGDIGQVSDVSLPTFAALSVTSIAVSSGTLSITTATPHALSGGLEVQFTSTSNTSLTGVYTVSGTPSASVLEVPTLSGDIASTPDSGTVIRSGYNINTGALLVYSAALTEWVQLEPPTVDNSAFSFNTGTQLWEEKPYTLAALGDTDFVTTPPAVGLSLTYDGVNWVPAPGSTTRGDGGDFTTPIAHVFALNVYGGGDFANTLNDEPVEFDGLLDAGQF